MVLRRARVETGCSPLPYLLVDTPTNEHAVLRREYERKVAEAPLEGIGGSGEGVFWVDEQPG